MSTSLCFNEIQFSPVTHNNQIWIRASELAIALGYSSEKSISNLYARNADEFSSDMSVVIKMVTGAFPTETRIFSLRGCHLIAMFARTAVAKAFRKWVLDVLDKLAVEAPAAQPALPSTVTPSTAADRRPLDKLVKVWAQQSGLIHATAWTQVNAHFNLDSVTQLPIEWIPDAIAFVEGKINALATIEAKPEPAALPPSSVPATRGRHRAQSQTELRLMDMMNEVNSLDSMNYKLEDFFSRLSAISGPLNLLAIDAMRRTNDRVPTDSLIQTLHYHRWDAKEHVRDAANAAREACRSAIVVARLLGV